MKLIKVKLTQRQWDRVTFCLSEYIFICLEELSSKEAINETKYADKILNSISKQLRKHGVK